MLIRRAPVLAEFFERSTFRGGIGEAGPDDAVKLGLASRAEIAIFLGRCSTCNLMSDTQIGGSTVLIRACLNLPMLDETI